MLYKNKGDVLSDEQFKNPGSEYRAAPFWAWNDKLDPQELGWQIEQLKKMGFGGFHMHVRTGLATRYLGDDFMQAVDICVKKAKTEGMLAWLYDEDRWPSGAAGGLVTKNQQYRARHLLITRRPYGALGAGGALVDSSARASRTENGKLLACYDIRLAEDGTLLSYRRIGEAEAAEGFTIYAYLETAPDSSWYNNQAYLDTLQKEAVKEFIRTTHERYKQCESGEFGQTIPAIFTDEPQFTHKTTLGFAHEEKDVMLPWTNDIAETYRQAYPGEDLLESLPELLWELPSGQGPSTVRYHYHDHVAERFASAFADTCGSWCRENGLMLTGHMMEEPTLHSQTAALGEAMRSYRSFQLPGIDMLCDSREYTTAKQAQSASRQYGRPGVLSELYGVTNWDFDFRGHKLQGDWQAALGVTVRVPHLSWMSMKGEAKRDYPASLHYQAPWHEKYRYVEDHFARVNTAMTRGKPVTRVGVIHPVESFWLHWGPRDVTDGIRRQMDSNFVNLADWLLTGSVDFDYISESLLPQQCSPGDIGPDRFPVGCMAYETIVLPGMETIRGTTLERIKSFMRQGGRVICLGQPPVYADGRPAQEELAFLRETAIVPFEKEPVLTALSGLRDVEIRNADGSLSDEYLYQLRQEPKSGVQWLFIAHAHAPVDKDVPRGDTLKIKLRGEYSLSLYDTFTGEIHSLPCTVRDGFTQFTRTLYEQDSLLLRLEKSGTAPAYAPAEAQTVPAFKNAGRFLRPVPATLEEPNVLLLDIAEYALDDGPYAPAEEILRLDNAVRAQLGWPGRGGAIVQPWVENDTGTPHRLRLRFRFESRLAIAGTHLALENADTAEVRLNGEAAGKPEGWYVDKCIKTVPLPGIQQGENLLELSIPYGKKTDVEAAYLLGDFGVQLQGIRQTLTEPVTALAFGDICTQGLPFYGGNLTYHLEAETVGGELALQVSAYRGHLLEVSVDGNPAEPLIYSPYSLKLTGLPDGKHRVDLHYYGSRINTFGQLHCFTRQHWWWGPESWRTTGAEWSYEYRLWPQGVLKSPEVTAEIE